MLSIATQLNTPGAILGGMAAVHAMTDVTGFGLIGHLLAMCRGSAVGASIDVASVPLLPETLALARAGVVTGASARNWASSHQEATLGADVDDIDRAVLTDPQTSGGLLVACAPAAVESVLDVFAQDGFDRARVIGAIVGGDARIAVKRSHRQLVHFGECA